MAKAHLLIADDSVTQMTIFARNFHAVGYEVSQAFDGLDAIAKIAGIWPDLILIDQEMPKLTGMDVIEWIRKKGLDIPVILMTSHNSDELHAQSLKLGSDDYLQLPMAFSVMLAHVEARLKRHVVSSNASEEMRFTAATYQDCFGIKKNPREEEKEMAKKGYGEILRRERRLRGWSQEELVKRILELCARDGEYPALDVRTVGRWEREEHRPSPAYQSRLCQIFGRNAVQLGFID